MLAGEGRLGRLVWQGIIPLQDGLIIATLGLLSLARGGDVSGNLVVIGIIVPIAGSTLLPEANNVELELLLAIVSQFLPIWPRKDLPFPWWEWRERPRPHRHP